MVKAYIALIIVAFACSTGCGRSRSLSRDKAAELINQSPQFKPSPAKIPLTEDEVNRGVKAAFWTIRPTPSYIMFGPDKLLYMTEQGNRLFAGFEPQVQGRILDLREKLPLYVVEVTGVTDNGTPDVGQRVVEFTYNYRFDSLPPEVQDLLKDHPISRGKLAFRLYDDGWRLATENP